MIDYTPDVFSPSDDSASAEADVSKWHFYDLETGLFSGAAFTGTQADMAAQIAHKGAGIGAHAGDIDYLSQKKCLESGGVVDHKPEPPWDGTDLTLFVWAWDSNIKRWYLRPRAKKSRVDAWDAMKLARQAEIDAPLPTPYGIFDSDARGRAGIAEAASHARAFAAAGELVAITFTLADNQAVVLDSAAIAHVELLLAQKVQLVRAMAHEIRARIDAAAVEDLPGIQWPAS